ncbi:4Fe-4S dicluster domain-containing protein [Candidatus Desulforudis audaxviator]|uniref:4Fe-4S ferredoxin, iron-sulfur binding domain protein n=1 Tax=Desulforudis audaxviator (strain MP104C) TaxID=477974 RepID=B1I3I3_DESAP|nr:4Fe-4S dicluster domain-containing protein [Candidatus Desulforudis audaxviator]ACA59555.1 4Fe-4S ferredoxin, iron-sulfur binding domain protein [Candidatus Desulforudis audaxviator MP104C]AZK59539.1 4Fe-4S dicluster domain-containing protein [Candidatus Desulforudis audaxviator]
MELVERVAKRDPERMLGILFDGSKCIGCRACQMACKEANDLPYVPLMDAQNPRGATESENWNQPRLAAYNYIVMNTYLAQGKDGGKKWHHVRRACLHCQNPLCFEVCFVHSYRKTPEGPVVYAHPEICVGCRYCQLACPFLTVTLEWDDVFSRISKCHMCYPLVQQGGTPACVTACPTDALKFGKREALLQEAKARIAAAPDKYVDHVFGEKEVGGTGVLYISEAPFEELGFNTDVMQKSPTKYTWKYMQKAPILAISLPILFAALYVTTKRRAENEGGH